MKSRILFYAFIILLILVALILWFSDAGSVPETTKVFEASVNRDCAPWDGSAFVISISYDLISTLEVSIWQSPDMERPVAFSFPDKTGSVGNATYRSQFGSDQPLTGKVFLRSVSEETPINGDFKLLSKTGRKFQGKFTAVWREPAIACG